MLSTRVLRVVRPYIIIASLVAPGLFAAAPAGAQPATDPTIASVQKQLDVLAMHNSQIVDRYDGIRIRVAERVSAAATAARRSAQARHRYDIAHRQFVRIIQAQFEGSGLGAAGALLDSDSKNSYIDRLDILNLFANQDAHVVRNATKAKSAAAEVAERAAHLLGQAKAERGALVTARQDVEDQISTYQELLATLSVQQRVALDQAQASQRAAAQAAADQLLQPSASGSEPQPRVIITGAPSERAMIAVKFAIAQLGKPYRYGAAGPGSYDCSGLTMAAYRAAGVGLPHQAGAQYNLGHHVLRSQLLPGDLVFFYQPIGHVAIYIGNGLLISAPQPGQNVTYARLRWFPGYVGATRLT